MCVRESESRGGVQQEDSCEDKTFPEACGLGPNALVAPPRGQEGE